MGQVLSVAVCDDEAPEVERIKNLLLGKDYSFQVVIDAFSESQQLLSEIQQKKYDLVFLDIEMPRIDGFAMAEMLRSFSAGTEIIFVSNHEHLVFKSMGFKPFYFVRKAHLEEELPGVLLSFWKKTELEGIFCEFRTATGVRRMNVLRIIYLESMDHFLYIHHTSGMFVCRDQLGKREKELAVHGFVRIYRSYLVNCKFIQQVRRDDVLMKNGMKLPLSRGRRKAVLDALAQYMDRGDEYAGSH